MSVSITASKRTAKPTVVEFERIGRRREVPALNLPAGITAQQAAEHVYSYAGRFLGSREWTVDVYLNDGRVLIDGGRFGNGVIADATGERVLS